VICLDFQVGWSLHVQNMQNIAQEPGAKTHQLMFNHYNTHLIAKTETKLYPMYTNAITWMKLHTQRELIYDTVKKIIIRQQ